MGDYDIGLAAGKEYIKIKMENMFQEVGIQPNMLYSSQIYLP